MRLLLDHDGQFIREGQDKTEARETGGLNQEGTQGKGQRSDKRGQRQANETANGIDLIFRFM